jgi:3-hydroxyacyl-CoA dehydrogenase / enoyl-CoA hydratase / 3-hydroxybutyryl-CoA epimerase
VIDYSIDSDGVAFIVWNNPHGPVNVKNAVAIAAFIAAVDRAIADAAVKGAVIGSAKRDFIAGGDLQAIYAAATPDAAIANVAGVAACLRRMERASKPFVAALNGSALGGGLEVALACHYRVAVDDPRVRLGCPEVTLGLIPGAGATQRLPRLIGIAPATKMLLGGKLVGVAEAKALGFVDEIVPSERLQEAARAWALAHPQAKMAWDRPDFRYPDFHPQSREGRWFFFHQWPQLRRTTPAQDEAAGTLLHVLAQGLEREIDAGLAIELRYFGLAAASRAAKNRIRNRFFAAEAARKLERRPSGEPRFTAQRAGVVGAGLMGGGIALVCARAGFDTVLLDTDARASTAGFERIAGQLDRSVQQGRLSLQERDDTLARITPAANYAALAECDVVIEAVVESAPVKAEVFRRIAEVVGPQALIASNTSTLSITDLGQSLAQPENFIGLHFFAPVDRMALVEVILGRRTSARTHASALDLLKRLSKMAIVVNDGPGFFTSRVVAAYTREALTMLAEGVSPALIDNAAFIVGLPIGPLAMADLTSYELLADIIASLAREGRGTAAESLQALQTARRLVAAGRAGRRTGGGVYDYADDGKSLWPGLAGLFTPLATQPAVEQVVQRLLHLQSLETVHAMDEGIASDPLEIDQASVLGWSYPAFRGGPLAHIDDTGLSEFVRQCDALADQHGERFRAPTSLRRRAEIGQTYHLH